MTDKKIVIIGAGYGGMAAGVHLQKHHTPFALINKHSYHYFKTLLHEAAGGRDDFQTYAIHLADVLTSPYVQIMKETVVSFDRSKRTVNTETTTHQYDTLIISLGSQTSSFAIPGIKEYSLMLNTLEDAKHIRLRIENSLLSYKDNQNPDALKVVVGGGGLTGVELMGELADYLPQFLANHRIPTDEFELILVHGHSEILPDVDERLRQIAAQKLVERGVTLVLNQRIVEALPNQIVLSDRRVLHANTFIWTGGVEANPVLQTSGLTLDGRGRAVVNPYLQSINDENIYVIGDCACCLDETGNPLPPTGQVAEQMGQYVAQSLISARDLNQPFVFHNHGLAASLGPHQGVAEVGHIHASGITALVMKEGSKAKYLMHLGGIHALLQKHKQWIQI